MQFGVCSLYITRQEKTKKAQLFRRRRRRTTTTITKKKKKISGSIYAKHLTSVKRLKHRMALARCQQALLSVQNATLTFSSIIQNYHINILSSAEHRSPPKDKWISSPFHYFSSFSCCLSVILQFEKKGITPKFRMLCFVQINSVIFNLLSVWIL